MTSLLLAATLATMPAPVKVEVRQTSEGWQLLRGGKPYWINGVGGTDQLELLVKSGGNSMRGWGTETAAQDLEKMRPLGITYTVGVWLSHKGDMNYDDPAAVKKQLENVKKDVARLKDHPNVLMWGLGNEMENGNDTPALWKAIGEIAKEVKALDPNHPTMTVVAEISEQKIKHIQTYAPDIDVLGVNSYGGLPSLPERLKQAGWTKPYIVTEYGPLGPWEVGKTPWGAAYEPNSSEKARFYAGNYAHSIAGNKSQCLGAYAFLWGHKQETTPTWFGLFLPTGEPTGAVDVLQHAWTGKWPSNLAPEILAFEAKVADGKVTAQVVARDPEGKDLAYSWEIRPEIGRTGYAGEGEKTPAVLAGLTHDAKGPQLSCPAPKDKGAYRLYLKVVDPSGKAACANMPFRIE